MKMTGAQAVVKALELEGVDLLFGYPVVLLHTYMMHFIDRIFIMCWFAMNRVLPMRQMDMPALQVR